MDLLVRPGSVLYIGGVFAAGFLTGIAFALLFPAGSRRKLSPRGTGPVVLPALSLSKCLLRGGTGGLAFLPFLLLRG